MSTASLRAPVAPASSGIRPGSGGPSGIAGEPCAALPLMDFFHLCLPGGAVVIEAGVGDGRFTRECARLTGVRGRLLAFEPSPGKRASLQQSLRQRSLGNVTLFPYQLFQGAEETRFAPNGCPAAGASPPLIRTLDAVLNRLPLERLDVIKIDAGGHEPEALAGALQTMQRFSPVVMLACRSLARMCPGEFYRWLQALGWRLYEESFAPINDLPAFTAYYEAAEDEQWLFISQGPLEAHPLLRGVPHGADRRLGGNSPMIRRQAGCPLCGGILYGMGPSGRFTPGEPDVMPRCLGCQSLERHRAMRLVWNCLRPLLGRVRALQFAPDPSPLPDAFAALEVSVYGGENSLDIQDIDRGDASYDMVLCNHVLEHVADDAAALAELLRILAPGGVVQLAVPAPRSHAVTRDWGFPDWGRHGHYRVYGRDLWGRFVAAGPFAVLEVPVADPVTGCEDVVYFIARHGASLAPYAERLEQYARLRVWGVGGAVGGGFTGDTV